MRETPFRAAVAAVAVCALLVATPFASSIGAPGAAPESDDVADRYLRALANADVSFPAETRDKLGMTAQEWQRQAHAIQTENLRLSRELIRIAEDDDLSDRERSLRAAEAAVQSRMSFVGGIVPEEARGPLQQELRNIDTTRRLLDINDRDDLSRMEKGVRITQEAAQHQIRTLGVEGDIDPAPAPDHATLDEALDALFERYNVTPTAEQREELQALDRLSAEDRERLRDVVDWYLAFDRATRDAFEGVEPVENPYRDKLEDLREKMSRHDPTSKQAKSVRTEYAETARQAATAMGTDSDLTPAEMEAKRAFLRSLAKVIVTRTQLVEAVAVFHEDADPMPGPAPASNDPIEVPPAFAIDPFGEDTTYSNDVALLVDLGGNDDYNNNAGGNNLDGGNCDLTAVRAAAVAVDFSGEDTYDTGRDCGANGGGRQGAGVLIDAGGSDWYHAGKGGVNGGGRAGVGFLMDLGGSDTYRGENGAQGGVFGGLGSLIELGGDDKFGSNGKTSGGIHGGVDGSIVSVGECVGDICTRVRSGVGIGFMFDGGGNDAYHGHSGSTGGVSSNMDEPSAGYHFDASGNDWYEDTDVGGTGGVIGTGTGFSFDGAGDDEHYDLDGFDQRSNGRGTAGGVSGAVLILQKPTTVVGVGMMIDSSGNDYFRVCCGGTGGGGTLGEILEEVERGFGFFIDAAGEDEHVASGATAGGANVAKWGLSADLRGADTYSISSGPATGGGLNLGRGFMLDGHGDDVYTGGNGAVNGGGAIGGIGFLGDSHGQDQYLAGLGAVNGKAVGGCWKEVLGECVAPMPVASGLLLDTYGRDHYEDDEGGTGTDKTVVPKGLIGAQIDGTVPP